MPALRPGQDQRRAQKRAAGGVLHHVTMAYDIDAQKMLRVLRTGRETLSGKGIPSAVKRVDPLRRQTRLPREQVIAAMISCFPRRHGLTDGGLTPAELRGGARAGTGQVHLRSVDRSPPRQTARVRCNSGLGSPLLIAGMVCSMARDSRPHLMCG